MGNMKTELWEGAITEETYMEPDDVADVIIEGIKPRKNMLVQEIVIKDNKNKKH